MEKEPSWFTSREREIIDTIVKFNDITSAAKQLGLSPSTLYSVLYRMRRKLTKSRWDVNRANSWKRKNRLIARLLVPYMKIIVTPDLLPEG